MKQILLIFGITVLLLSACKKKDDNDTTKLVSPPAWIQGKWMDISQPAYARIGGFEFTSDNIIDYDQDENVNINFKDNFQLLVDSSQVTIEETKTNISYEVKITTNGMVTSVYNFEKGTDNTTIVYKLSSSIDVILTKQ